MSTVQPALKSYEMLIGGEFVASAKTLEVVNPATEEIISQFPSGTVADVNSAVLAAEKAQKPWAALPAIRRATHLREIAALLRANRESLARVITEAVSYTHLDVYKRQPPERCGRSPHIRKKRSG